MYNVRGFALFEFRRLVMLKLDFWISGEQRYNPKVSDFALFWCSVLKSDI
jgi:hypothetical protein